MKNTVIIIFLLMLGTLAVAQEANTPKSSFRINILNSGIGGEFQIALAQTFSANLNVAPNFSASFPAEETGLESEQYFALLPTFDAEYRFYYNRQKRIEKEQTIYNNTGPYLAPRFSYTGNQLVGSYPTSAHHSRTELGGMIGYQKTFASNLQLGVGIGVGIGIYNSGISSTFLASFNFSYIIIPKKWR